MEFCSVCYGELQSFSRSRPLNSINLQFIIAAKQLINIKDNSNL